MSIADYDEVLHLWQNSEGVGLNESDTRKAVADYLKRNPGMSFVAREGTDLIVAVLCGHDGRRGYLHHLAVSPAYRRKGHAARGQVPREAETTPDREMQYLSLQRQCRWRAVLGGATAGKNDRMFGWSRKISPRPGINVAVNPFL